MSGFKGKKNVYLCGECGHGFVTLDVDEGVTPFMTSCLNCEATATSCMYRIPQEVLGNPAVRWIRPPKEMWSKFTVWKQDHLEKGGLIRDDDKTLAKLPKKRKAFRP